MSFSAGTISKLSVSPTSVVLSSSAASGGTGPYTYQWYRNLTSGFTPGAGNLLAGQTSLTITDLTVIPGTQYYYVIRATDTGNGNVTSDSAQFSQATLLEFVDQNQLGLKAYLGLIDERLDYATFPVQIDHSELGHIYPGQPISLVDSMASEPQVIAATVATGAVFGYVNYDSKNPFFVAGSAAEISQPGNIIYLRSVEPISRGASVYAVYTTIGGVSTQSLAEGPQVGIAFDKSDAAGQLIRVKLSDATSSNVTLSLANVGSSPNSKAATLVTGVLTLQPANGSFPGVLTAADWTSFSGKLTSPLSTKGDLLGFSSVNARIPVGANGQVLTADSTQTLGVKWAAAGGAGTVTGPVSSTNRAISTWNGTGGTALFDNPLASIDSSGNITGNNLSGTNSGDVTLAAVGSSPSANAATLSGQVLTIQPADGTHPGVLTSGAQTIGGAKTLSATLSLGGHLISNVLDPASAQDAATKNYVDLIGNGLSWKQAVRSATTAGLPSYTYNNGASGVGATITGVALSALPAQDGVTLVNGDRLLVKDETSTNAPYNGIYVVTNVGSAGVAFVLTRSTDLNLAAEFVSATVQVSPEASTQAGYGFRQNTDPVVVGTTAVSFVNFSIGVSYSFSNGVQLSGAAVSANVDNSTIAVSSNQIIVKSNGVTNTQLAQMPTLTLKGNNTGGTANALDLTVSQVNTMLGNSGDVTLSAFGSTPNANAASLSGQALTLQPADGTHPGGVSITTQTFAGNKTFTGSISASNLSGTNTGDVTIGTANGLSLAGQALSLALSSTSTTGALSSTDWNTFNSKGSGSVTSVALTLPSFLSVAGSPVTTSGTLAVTLANQSGNTVFASPSNGSSGSPLFRSLVTADIPALPYASSILTSSHIFVGNGSNVATDVAMSGDATLSNTGAITLATVNTAGTYTKVTTNVKGLVTSGAAAQLASADFANQGSTTTVLHGNASGNPSFGAVSLTADVSGILPILNGGTGQSTASAAFGALSPLTTKGDLLGFSTVNARLPVGTDGFTLTADSTQTLGVKWSSAGSGTVTTVSVASANGLAGSVANATTTPAITLSTTITGVLKGNGTAISAASAGTDYQAPVSVGALDAQAANAQGLAFVSNVLSQQSADASHPGLVNNTTQTFGGAKTFPAPFAVSGSNTSAVTINTSAFVFDSTNSALGINNASPASGSFIDAINSTGSPKRIILTGYGTGSTVGNRGRFARGTAGSPTAAQSGDVLSFISGQGYGATTFPAASTGVMNIVAGGTFTDSSMPTYQSFSVTPSASVTAAEAMRINSTGNILIAQTSDDATNKLQVTGGTIATGTVTGSAHISTGTAGAGYLQIPNQSAAPGTPTTAGRLYWDNSNRMSWIGTNGFTRSLDATANTANRIYGLPDVSANVVVDSLAYGDGSAGNVTISSGTTTLTQDTYYANLTLSGTGILNPAGFRIFVSGILDITAAPAAAIKLNGSNGNTSVGSAGGTGGNSGPGVTIGFSSTGGTGATAVTGNGATAATPSAIAANGGNGGTAGASGAGTGGTSAAGRAFAANLTLPFRRIDYNLVRGSALIAGGGAGPGGSSGGGDGTNTGGGGGGGGGFAGTIGIWANTINRGGSTAAGAIQVIGGNGGNGRTQVTGTVGGGGGGAGGGGGWVYIVYNTLTGSTATNAIDVTAGGGGAGGNGVGAGGNGGAGGGTGVSGRVTLISASTGTVTDTVNTVASTAGNAASGATGGGTQSATSAQVSL